MVLFIVVLAAAYLFVKIPKGFIPDRDTDQIAAVTEAPQNTSFYKMVDVQDQVARSSAKIKTSMRWCPVSGEPRRPPWGDPITASWSFT
jgi:multidrug efflux pump subunit AcrB